MSNSNRIHPATEGQIYQGWMSDKEGATHCMTPVGISTLHLQAGCRGPMAGDESCLGPLVRSGHADGPVMPNTRPMQPAMIGDDADVMHVLAAVMTGTRRRRRTMGSSFKPVIIKYKTSPPWRRAVPLDPANASFCTSSFPSFLPIIHHTLDPTAANMTTRTLDGLTTLLQGLDLDEIPTFPSADPLRQPVDIFHAYLAVALQELVGCDVQQAYDSIQPANTVGNGDLDIVLPKLKLPGNPDLQDLAADLARRVCLSYP